MPVTGTYAVDPMQPITAYFLCSQEKVFTSNVHGTHRKPELRCHLPPFSQAGRSPRARAGFRVSNVLTQTALIEQHTVRERLLAVLALFFGVVALTLAGVGLYGVLDYSVLHRRREIAIRLAIGAQPREIAQSVIIGALAVVLMGSLFGIILGIACVRFIATLLFDVKATALGVLAFPAVAIFGVALLAALPAVVRAVRTDPVRMLRSE